MTTFTTWKCDYCGGIGHGIDDQPCEKCNRGKFRRTGCSYGSTEELQSFVHNEVLMPKGPISTPEIQANGASQCNYGYTEELQYFEVAPKSPTSIPEIRTNRASQNEPWYKRLLAWAKG